MSDHQARLAAEIAQYEQDTKALVGRRFLVSFKHAPNDGLEGQLVNFNWTRYTFNPDFIIEAGSRVETHATEHHVERADVFGMAVLPAALPVRPE